MNAEGDRRVIALIDMDCFYVQVEERENPNNKGKPACVVQYRKWKGGGIISVNYEARAAGVTRQMRGDEAREKCPDCILYRVPERRGKADLTKYRDGGKEVIDVMCSFGVCVERASIDEAYIDMTMVIEQTLLGYTATDINVEELPNTHFVGWENGTDDVKGVHGWLKALSKEDCNDNDWKLTLGAVLVEKMRAAIYEKTGFRCSAGIANNKMLAKLACGINKPNKQTVLPFTSVQEFFTTFPLKKVRNLGGKLGLTLREELQCTTMADITRIPEKILQERFDTKTGTWLYWYARGIDHDPVSSRRLPKSIGCNKNFTGLAALDSEDKIGHWLEELCAEVSERLEKDRGTNCRLAKLLTVTVRLEGDIRPYSYTRSLPLHSSYDKTRMAKSCLAVVMKENPCKQGNSKTPWVVTCLGVSASKFVDQLESSSRIDRFFTQSKASKQSTIPNTENEESVDEEPLHRKDELYDLHADQEEEEFGMTEIDNIPTETNASNIIAPESHVGQISDLSKEIFQENKEKSSGASSPCRSREKNENVKKTGFFASRSLKKCVPIPHSSEESIAQSSQVNPVNQTTFSIEEIFPDLNQVDMETLALLPPHLRRQVLQAIQSKQGNEGTDEFVVCDKCKEQFLKEEIGEHNDFHVAAELQKEFSLQPSTSRSSVNNLEGSKVVKNSSKRPLKNQKNATKDTKRSRTIESFFGSSV
ncbi:hypothetical protein GHT06_011746 [Daphnia sinensis]|uniref:DNA polymerase eta n=1 Tax=Daphnia sinensis TaxID=1820382 RepID=A0AAD5KUE7_9CRUS|nr:hypothetical protein GHT06_011746 [Daphnia sinensis]